MRLRVAILSGLFIGLGLTGNARAHSDDIAAAKAEKTLSVTEQKVVAVLSAYAIAFENADIDAIHALIADDSRFSYFEGAGADSSWADYAAHTGSEMQAFSETNYQLKNISPEVSTSGSMAFATFEWQLDVVILSEQFENGRHPVAMTGLGTAVLVQHDGSWRLRHLHTARK